MRCIIVVTFLSLSLALFSMPMGVVAEETGRVPRIGILVDYLGPSMKQVKEFQEGLREVGWIVGQNIRIEIRNAGGKIEPFPELAAELVRLDVDVILALSTPSTRAALGATAKIPIVFAHVSDPVGSGFVASLARPGGNATGLSLNLTELSGKLLQLLMEAVPNASSVAVLWNPAHPARRMELKVLQNAARALEVQLKTVELQSAGDFEPAFTVMKRERPDGLIVLVDAFMFSHRKRIAEFTLETSLPTISNFTPFAVQAQLLMAYSSDLSGHYRRAAAMVDKILRGAKPADLPVERPMSYLFTINLKTAKKLGITIPESLLMRADQVIE